MTQAFFKAMQQHQLISADTVWNYARRELMPPKEVSTRMSSYFRRFIASGYLRRTGRFVTSSRNDSSPLPQYLSTLYANSAPNNQHVPKLACELVGKEHGNEQKASESIISGGVLAIRGEVENAARKHEIIM